MAKIGRNQPCPCGSGKKYKRCCQRADEKSRAGVQPAGRGLDGLWDDVLRSAPESERGDVGSLLLAAHQPFVTQDVEGIRSCTKRLGELMAEGEPLAELGFPSDRFDRVADDVLAKYDDADPDDDGTRDTVIREVAARVATPPQLARIRQRLVDVVVDTAAPRADRITSATAVSALAIDREPARGPVLHAIVGRQLSDWIAARVELETCVRDVAQRVRAGEVSIENVATGLEDLDLDRLAATAPGVFDETAERSNRAVEEVLEELQGDSPLPLFTLDEVLELQQAAEDLLADLERRGPSDELVKRLVQQLADPLGAIMTDVVTRCTARAMDPHEPERKRFARLGLASRWQPTYVGVMALLAGGPLAHRSDEERRLAEQFERERRGLGDLAAHLRQAGHAVAAGRLESLLEDDDNPEPGPAPGFYELRVTLMHIRPPIWRRFLIRSDATFEDLHHAIQDAFGWESNHLWEFREPGRSGESIAGLNEDGGDGDVELSDYFGAGETCCIYLYDFGDNWEHQVTLRKQLDGGDTFRRRLLAGKRACPPEDCGGVPGYYRLVRFAETSEDEWGEDPDELREWLGDWSPGSFDVKAVKATFDR